VQGRRCRGAGAGVQVQGCRCRGAGAGVQVQGCRCRGAGAGVQVQGCRCRGAGAGVAGAGVQVPGCRCRGAGAGVQVKISSSGGASFLPAPSTKSLPIGAPEAPCQGQGRSAAHPQQLPGPSGRHLAGGEARHRGHCLQAAPEGPPGARGHRGVLQGRRKRHRGGKGQ